MYCHHGITTYSGGNTSIGFTLFDIRGDPTAEEAATMAHMDELASWLKNVVIGCAPLGSMVCAVTDDKDVKSAADRTEFHIVRPPQPPKRARYCNVKIVPAKEGDYYNSLFRTVLAWPNGNEVDMADLYSGFHIVPFVEPEEIFLSPSTRSIQLKLREGVVTRPPVVTYQPQSKPPVVKKTPPPPVPDNKKKRPRDDEPDVEIVRID